MTSNLSSGERFGMVEGKLKVRVGKLEGSGTGAGAGTQAGTC